MWKQIGNALLFGILTALFIALPLYGVRHEFKIPDWKEVALFAMLTATAMACGFRFDGFVPKSVSEDGLIIAREKEYFQIAFFNRNLKIEKTVQPLYFVVLIYFILYFMCCMLCQKMGLAQVVIYLGSCSSACLGLSFSLFGLILVIMNRTVRSIKWGWLFFCAGLPILYQTWFPLLALPGIFVVLGKMLKTK